MTATGTGQHRGAVDGISIPDETWIDRECAQCSFADVRLEKRFRKLVEQLSERMGESIPLACQDWASTKAAYRFFSNDRVSEEDILRGHFQSTRDRFAAAEGPVLILHDTSEFTYKGTRTVLSGSSADRRMPNATGGCRTATRYAAS